MIHIVFEPSGAEVLAKSMELDESLQGEVFVIKDDYAVGPLENLDTPEGWQARRDWWKMLLENSAYTDSLSMVDDKLTLKQIKDKLTDGEEAWIWAAQNQHDVCGYYWLMSQLPEFQGKVQILYLNNLPFINEKGNIFYPTNLYEIQPKEFLKAMKLARPITPAEFEIDPDEWKKLCDENAVVRLLEGGKKIISSEATFYDKDIMANVTKAWQKASRVITVTLNKMKIKTGDVFLAWRIQELGKAETIELQGDITKGWKEFEIKLPSNNLVENDGQ